MDASHANAQSMDLPRLRVSETLNVPGLTVDLIYLDPAGTSAALTRRERRERRSRPVYCRASSKPSPMYRPVASRGVIFLAAALRRARPLA
jgi:hypothetical protein